MQLIICGRQNVKCEDDNGIMLKQTGNSISIAYVSDDCYTVYTTCLPLCVSA